MELVSRRPLLFVGLYGAAFATALVAAVIIGLFFLNFHPTLISVGAGVNTVVSLFGVPALVAVAVRQIIRSPEARTAMGPVVTRLVPLAVLYCLAFLAALAATVAFDVAIFGYRPRMAAIAASVPLVGMGFALLPMAIIVGELVMDVRRTGKREVSRPARQENPYSPRAFS